MAELSWPMKPPAWSYSSISLYKTCPRKYYAERVSKEIPYLESEAQRYGTELHQAAEEYIRDGKPLDPRFGFMLPILDKLASKPGVFHCEMKLGLKKEGDRYVSCEFFDKEVWFRGVADLVILCGDKAYIVDYKTGKSSRYADTTQLDLMAASIFIKYPQIKKIYAALIFVVLITREGMTEDDWFIRANYDRDQALAVFSKLYPHLEQRRVSYDTGVFNPNPNGLCKAWCAVSSCPHHGGRR